MKDENNETPGNEEENKNKYILSDGSLVTCFINDINGDEQENIDDKEYKDIDGCIIVYDISKKKSFEDVQKIFVPKIKSKCNKNIKVILLGNKSDLNYIREVTAIEGNQLALNNHFYFKETSTIEKNTVADAFQTIIETTNFEKNKKEKRKKDKKDKKDKKNSHCLLF